LPGWHIGEVGYFNVERRLGGAVDYGFVSAEDDVRPRARRVGGAGDDDSALERSRSGSASLLLI
jgi:hypothetical protein